MTFSELQLIKPILRAVEAEGYTTPTPIQSQAIPVALKQRDVLGCAQTGTGKTAAFAIPIIQLLEQESRPEREKRKIRSLILTPTRELAIQIADSFKTYGQYTSLNYSVIFGGVNQFSQVEELKKGVDILIATPGRLLDLMNQNWVNLSHVRFFVLDEADRMLDMGFVHDVRKVIAKLPTKRQSLFFSATMPPAIVQLADSILTNPIKVEVTPVSSTAHTINQSVYFVDKTDKRALLQHVIEEEGIQRVLVFTRTKHGADRVAKDLVKAGISAEAIHGNKSQNARQKALANFKSQTTRVLVATDIAARGIDIDELTHVINYELPNIPESYVHRIGRTGRAGAKGIAIGFCDDEEKAFLKDIQKLIGRSIPVIEEHPYPLRQNSLESPKAVSGKPTQSERNARSRSSFRGRSTSGKASGPKKTNERVFA